MTHIVANEPCTLTAHYAPAHYVTILKDPERNDKGFIQIDHVRHDSTSYVTTWWGAGSYHDIYVPTFDSIGVVDTSGAVMVTERFSFDHWSDFGDTLHRVGPITRDEMYTAYYGAQYMCAITKSPPHSTGEFYIDGVTHTGTPSVVVWWDPGSSHDIAVSRIDECGLPECDTSRFFFETWRDGVTTAERTVEITESAIFTAEYEKKMRIRIEKNPPHAGGAITLDDSTVHASSYDFWVDAGFDHTLSVSEYDIDTLLDPDRVYRWESYDHGGTREQSTGVLDGHRDYVANYSDEIAVLAYSVTVGGERDSFWVIDTVEVREQVTMIPPERFTITNIGNTPLDFGLNVTDVTDRMWVPGYYPTENVFVVRAQFNDETVPPAPFSMSRDYIKDELSWATAGIFGVFGPSGTNMLPWDHYPGSESTDNLWLQFVAPTTSTFYNVAMEIKVKLNARYYMP